MFALRLSAAALAVPILLAATGLPGRGQAPAEDYTKVDPRTLGIEPVSARKDPATGFVVGGRNPTALLRKLTEIAGRKIAALEKDMRPAALSRSGFLGKDERLLDVLVADNVYVVEELKTTHQELARHLHIAGALARRQYGADVKARRQPGYKEFIYHGRKYKAKAACARGYQESPFEDGTKANCNVELWNLGNGKKLTFSVLVPHMIERYGFYEGHGTPYRVDPRAVVAVFDFLKPVQGN